MEVIVQNKVAGFFMAHSVYYTISRMQQMDHTQRCLRFVPTCSTSMVSCL